MYCSEDTARCQQFIQVWSCLSLGDSVCDLDSPGTVGVRKNNLLSSTSLYIN